MLVSAGLALAAPLVVAAAAEQSSAQPAVSRQLAPRAVVAEVRRIIAERYVLPERRPAIDAILSRGLASGRYDVGDAGVLAERINADLETAGQDRHLNFSHNPQQAAMMAAARNEAAPDASGYERQVRAGNHGITELRVLPGNVRYMAYDGFNWIGPESAAALDNAMRFLSGGDAVIIDIRRNGGGSPEAVQYLTSHFMEPGRPLMSFYMNGSATPDRTETLAELPTGRMVGKPLYVLTSGRSASAAEEFAGHVGGYRLGQLVGETTAGAGFRNDLMPIAGAFVLSVSVGRAVLASTGRDWEATGIAPTVRTPVPQALDVAQVHALRQLASRAPEADRPRLLALADGFLARTEQRSPALPAAAYAGRFGERVVSLEGGKLYYQRGSQPRAMLIPLGGNRFALESDPMLRAEFIAAGNSVSAFELGAIGMPPQGRYPRTTN